MNLVRGVVADVVRADVSPHPLHLFVQVSNVAVSLLLHLSLEVVLPGPFETS